MTIEEKLQKYRQTSISFYEAYSDCTPIEEIEGQILENATHCGYAVTDKDGNRYFTDYGIRGCSRGTFRIKDGVPEKVIECPSSETLKHVSSMVASYGNTDEFQIYRYLIENWYDKQTE